MAVNLHDVIGVDNQGGGVGEAVVDVDIEAVVAFRHLHQDNVNHRPVRFVKLFISLVLEDSIRLSHGHAGQVQERNIPVVVVHHILLNISVFVRICPLRQFQNAGVILVRQESG